MFARHTFITGDPQQIERAIEAITRDVGEWLTKQSELGGVALFADRDLGKLLLAVLWDSEKARHEGGEYLHSRWTTLLDSFAATMSVQDFEVASVFEVRRPTPGAGMRRLLLDFDPGEAKTVMEVIRDVVTSTLDKVPGLSRASALVDRSGGRAAVLFTCADQAALARSRGYGRQVRR